MKNRVRTKINWTCLLLLAAFASCAWADTPLATYTIGWDDGDGDSQNGQWHTVPRLLEGPSTIHFLNSGVKSEVQTGPDGVQVFKSILGTLNGDLLVFAEPSTSARHYVVRGEVRWENITGHASITLGVGNSNYVGAIGVASTPDGNKLWSGTQDWQPFTLVCDMSPALGGPNQFIAEMALKSAGAGVLYLRNLRLEVYGARPLTAAGQPRVAHFSPASFSMGSRPG